MATVPFHVPDVVIEMPADGTGRSVTFTFPAPVDDTWTVVAAGDQLAAGSGTTSITASFPADAVGQMWALRHGGQERISGPLITRPPAAGAPAGDELTIEVDDAGTTISVDIVEVGTGPQGDPGVVAATGLATYDAETQTIDVTATASDVGAPPSARTITAGTGLTGGGDLSADRTITADLSSSNGAALGTAAPGVATTIARADHVHPMPDAADVGADATGTAAARTQVGALASRPSASGVDDGTRYFATDDGGGTVWVVDAETWVQAAPAVSGVSRLLDIAEPASIPSQVIAAANTDYRIAEMTVDFAMPDQRVRIDTSELIIYQLAVNTTAQMSLWYSLDGWASKVCLLGNVSPSVPGTAIFYLHRFAVQSVFLPSSIAAGESVSVALHVATTSGTPTLSVGVNTASDRAQTRRPYIAATAV